ncbi:MAG: hypothetical protein QW532_04985 [Archaeoglobaceae archaeon]
MIIDSSDKEKFEEMKNRIPYARIYWLPPLGMADFYYKIGLELCKNEWILHLDDDEEPSDELLRDLRTLADGEVRVYAILRSCKDSKVRAKVFRFFNKDYISPTGLIHVPWVSKVNPFFLDEKYYLNHYEENVNIKKFKKYAVYESWQYCCKIMVSIFGTYIRYQNPSKFVKKLGRVLFYQSKLGKFGWFLLATEYNLYNLFNWIKSSRTPKFIIYSFIYSLFIQINLLKDFSKKLEASLKMWEVGVFEFLGVDSYENALKNLEGLNSRNGLENFVKLVERRLQKF